MKVTKADLIALIVLLIILICCAANADVSMIEGNVIDKWTVTKNNCYFDEYCGKVTRYFISLDSTYDDIEVDKVKYNKAKIGSPFQCIVGICNVMNEMNARDRE